MVMISILLCIQWIFLTGTISFLSFLQSALIFLPALRSERKRNPEERREKRTQSKLEPGGMKGNVHRETLLYKSLHFLLLNQS